MTASRKKMAGDMLCMMKRFSRGMFAAVPLFVCSMAAAHGAVFQAAPAQKVEQPGPRASQAGADAGDQWLAPNAFLNAANQISRKFSAGDAAAIYDQVSPILRSRFTREAFVQELKRKLPGKVLRRNWQGINQFMVVKSDKANADKPGEYVAVTLISVVEMAPSSLVLRSEVLSFFHEENGAWLLSGYNVGSQEKVGSSNK